MEVDSRVADVTINGSAVHIPTVDKDDRANGTPSSPNGHGVTGAPIHAADESAPRDSIQSGSSGSHSTSMSSLTVSTAPRTSVTEATAYGSDFPTSFSPAAMAILSPSVEPPKPIPVPCSPEGKEGDLILARSLSFRTDSTGSMGSLVSNLNLSEGAAETGSSTPDSSYDTPKKRNQNQNSISSASILISALKNRRAVVHKKSVSFSLPSEDDIARKAQKMNSALLYDGLEEFDNNMLDYQISSPKTSLSGKPRAYASPTRSERPSVQSVQPASNVTGIAAMLLSSDSTRTTPSIDENIESAIERSQTPLQSNVASGVASLGRKKSDRGGLQAKLVAPPSGRKDALRTAASSAANQSDTSTPASSSSGVNSGDHQQTQQSLPPPPVPSLMQRVAAASTAEELCRVFDIASESVFTGEIMNKRFSRDVIAKDRFVWIVPRTKSIHWAKDAKDRLDNHKIKYFLLDKNSPHINTTEMLSTASSCKEDPARRGRPPLPSTPSPERTNVGSFFNRAELLGASTEASGSGDEAGFGAPEEEHASNVAMATGDGADQGEPLNNHAIPERASGELVGIIHSAVINHLSIKIKTESGDYLSLTIKSNATAVQRAKDWFNVIKTLTKDVSVSAQDASD